MIDSIDSLIRRIHASPRHMVIAITGGGSQAIGRLLSVPGGSRTLLEAIIPYSSAALEDFLRTRPEQFCSPRTARLMAMAAFQRARHLISCAEQSAPGDPTLGNTASIPHVVGIGCTASLASDRPKRGPHRVHVAFQTVDRTVTHSLELIKGRRSRAEEEKLAAELVLNNIAEAFGVEVLFPLPLIETEHVDSTCTLAAPAWQDLLLGNRNCVSHSGGKPPEVRAVFPGAFNPLHAGHVRMAQVAAKRLNEPVHFEISIENVDKPPLDYTEMEQRAAQFAEDKLPLWFTRAPTFVEKSAQFPNATFIVGADTIVRIGQPKYYAGRSVDSAMSFIAKNGCRFLVFGRICDDKFQTLADLSLPESLRNLCDEIPSSDFREDISSTQLRSQANAD